MTDQPTTETDTRFIPPAARNLPLAALDSATRGADMLDAHALTPSGRNFLAHALVQLARDGWLRAEPGAGFEPVADDPAAPTPPQDGPHVPQDGPEAPDAGAESLAARAALIRDQAALAQVRLLIAAHRPRLRLADPVLLGKLERVVAQVGELEPAQVGERP